VWLKELAATAVDLLFPPRCVACHRFGAWLCADCVKEIEVIHPPICPRCGLPLDSEARDNTTPPKMPFGCNRCRSAPFPADRLRAYAFHSGPLREAIHQLKYQDLRALAAPLGQLMAEGWANLSRDEDGFDVIVPVPLHRARLRQRGYNQAALLARALGAHLQRPVAEDTLVRVKATAPQVDLDAQARRANVRDAFLCSDTSLAGKRVLLVDDVCTTGATLEAASVALRDGGASSVWAYTLARARGQAGPDSDKSR
jgi:ComF family protein